MAENVVINDTTYNGVDTLALVRADGSVATFFPDAVRYNAQTLTEDQKAQARQNMGIVGTGEDGQRGTGILKVTSSTTSSSGTSPTGIAIKYKIALSSVKSEAGVAEVLIGDIVLRSYYLYPVANVDTSYVYLGAYTSIRGSAGTTPKKGTDYWTTEDQASIVQQVITALPVYNGEVV